MQTYIQSPHIKIVVACFKADNYRNFFSVLDINRRIYMYTVVLGGLAVIVLATGSKARGFKPGRGRRTFKGEEYGYDNIRTKLEEMWFERVTFLTRDSNQ
jgi:hypothetical protein